jgi:2'-5' RNA ligase
MSKKTEGAARTFVALEVPTSLVKPLARIRDRYGKLPYLRWTLVRDWHTTLLFIGATPRFRIEEVVAALDPLARVFGPIPLTVERIGYAPPDRPPSMVWVYLSYSPLLEELARLVTEAVRCLAVPEDPRVGTLPLPHITLARFRDRRPVPAHQRVTFRVAEVVGTEHLFSRLALYESCRMGKGRGTTYRQLASWRLSGN